MGWENKNAKSGIGKRKLEKEILETKMGKRNSDTRVLKVKSRNNKNNCKL